MITNGCKGLLRVLSKQSASHGCSCCFQGSWLGSDIVYKHVFHAFERFFKTQLLIVKGLSLGSSF